MKNKSKILVCIIVLLLIIILLMVCALLYYHNKYNEYKLRKEDKVRIYEKENEENNLKVSQENEKEAERKKFLEENVYDNNIPLGIYLYKNGKYVLTNELYCDWGMEKVFSMFYVLPSNKETLGGNFKTLFTDEWKKYQNDQSKKKYKIGYNVKYTLATGEKKSVNVLDPDIATTLFSDLQFYLYDDVTDMGNRIYYHLRQYEMTENTLITSVKMVGDRLTPYVNGPIELTAFTYDGDDDFDSQTKEYLGNSKYTIKIYREKIG